jgi:hypothetical protein
MAAQTKSIYGQAYIIGNSLVQDIIFLVTDGKNTSRSENTVIVIEDIWEDLLSVSGQAIEGRPGYWYWEVDMTDIEDPDTTVKMRINCPKPGPEVFNNDFEIEPGDSDWAKYWKGKIQEALDSPFNSKNALTPEEVILPGTKYIDQNGDLVTLEDVKVTREGLSDVQNLMMSLF